MKSDDALKWNVVSDGVSVHRAGLVATRLDATRMTPLGRLPSTRSTVGALSRTRNQLTG